MMNKAKQRLVSMLVLLAMVVGMVAPCASAAGEKSIYLGLTKGNQLLFVGDVSTSVETVNDLIIEITGNTDWAYEKGYSFGTDETTLGAFYETIDAWAQKNINELIAEIKVVLVPYFTECAQQCGMSAEGLDEYIEALVEAYVKGAYGGSDEEFTKFRDLLKAGGDTFYKAIMQSYFEWELKPESIVTSKFLASKEMEKLIDSGHLHPVSLKDSITTDTGYFLFLRTPSTGSTGGSSGGGSSSGSGGLLVAGLAAGAAVVGGVLAYNTIPTFKAWVDGLFGWAEDDTEPAPTEAEAPYADEYVYEVYRANYPDLVAAFGDDRPAYLDHWLTCGKAEGRVAK